jgi:2-polyprenyl-3-methyl-5-hydroxy-6-metoxy-1,4-benzoquinol methylase
MNPFEQIYQNNIWNGVESLSGPGSGSNATRHMAEELATLVRTLDVNTVLDVACGDGYWMPALPGYTGIDISPTAIERAKRNAPSRNYLVADFLTEDFSADLIIMRDVLQHLPISDAVLMVRRAWKRCDWLLASTYRSGKNTGLNRVKLMQGRSYDNDLQQKPFSLGEPVAWIPDGYVYEGHGIRDSRKMLGLWSTS